MYVGSYSIKVRGRACPAEYAVPLPAVKTTTELALNTLYFGVEVIDGVFDDVEAELDVDVMLAVTEADAVIDGVSSGVAA